MNFVNYEKVFRYFFHAAKLRKKAGFVRCNAHNDEKWRGMTKGSRRRKSCKTLPDAASTIHQSMTRGKVNNCRRKKSLPCGVHQHFLFSWKNVVSFFCWPVSAWFSRVTPSSVLSRTNFRFSVGVLGERKLTNHGHSDSPIPSTLAQSTLNSAKSAVAKRKVWFRIMLPCRSHALQIFYASNLS